MKKMILTKENANSFAGIIRKKVKRNKSMIFPGLGKKITGSKFGSLRKETSCNPHRLTTDQVAITVTEKGIAIQSPLNKGYGYANTTIPFGKIVLAYDSIIWRTPSTTLFSQYYRQLRFSKEYGWALIISRGRMIPHLN